MRSRLHKGRWRQRAKGGCHQLDKCSTWSSLWLEALTGQWQIQPRLQQYDHGSLSLPSGLWLGRQVVSDTPSKTFVLWLRASGTEFIKVLRQVTYPCMLLHLVGPLFYILKASMIPQTLAKVCLEESPLLGCVSLPTLHTPCPPLSYHFRPFSVSLPYHPLQTMSGNSKATYSLCHPQDDHRNSKGVLPSSLEWQLYSPERLHMLQFRYVSPGMVHLIFTIVITASFCSVKPLTMVHWGWTF